jgi:hypothetical protein
VRCNLNGRSYRLGALLSTRPSVIYNGKDKTLELVKRREFHIEKRFFDWAKSLGKPALTKEIYIWK